MSALRFFPTVIATALLSLALIACQAEGPTLTATATVAPSPTPTSLLATPAPTPTPLYPITVVDSTGTEIVFEEPPQRIISLSPAYTEIFFALGAGDRVVGRDRYSNYPIQAEVVATVGDAFNIDLERVASLEPDLVYLDFDNFKPDLENLGIRVIVLSPPDDMEGVLEGILLWGRILGRLPQAEELVSGMRQRIRLMEERLSQVEKGPRVFYELDPSLFSVGLSTFIGDVLARVKAENIAAEAEGDYPQLSGEFIVAQDPQVILLADSLFYTTMSETPETVAARPGWNAISAVSDGRVYPVDPDLLSRPGPRIVEGLEQLARILYPELFP